jgi:hypothetical protein
MAHWSTTPRSTARWHVFLRRRRLVKGKAGQNPPGRPAAWCVPKGVNEAGLFYLHLYINNSFLESREKSFEVRIDAQLYVLTA